MTIGLFGEKEVGQWEDIGKYSPRLLSLFNFVTSFFSFYFYSYSEGCQTSHVSFSPRSLFYLSHALGTMTLQRPGFSLSLNFGT